MSYVQMCEFYDGRGIHLDNLASRLACFFCCLIDVYVGRYKMRKCENVKTAMHKKYPNHNLNYNPNPNPNSTY